MARLYMQLMVLALAITFATSLALAQSGDHHGDRVRGRILSITGNTIELSGRDGGTTSVVTTGNTTFRRGGRPATLDDFATGDAVVAVGSQNGNGAFVADAVRGVRPPHASRVGGAVQSVDVAQGALTVTTENGDTVVIYTTADTRLVRDRAPATLADFVPGDRVRAHGERDPNEQFLADRVLGSSGSGQ